MSARAFVKPTVAAVALALANVSFAWHVWQARAAIDAAQSAEGER